MRGAIALLAGLALAAPAAAARPLGEPATYTWDLGAPSLFRASGFGTTVVVRP